MRDRLKQDNDFRCGTGVNQERDTAEECPDIKLSVSWSCREFCYFGDIIRARGCAVDIVLARIRKGWSKSLIIFVN